MKESETIERLKKSYMDTMNLMLGRKYKHGRPLTNLGDIQAMKLARIKELGSLWNPPIRWQI